MLGYNANRSNDVKSIFKEYKGEKHGEETYLYS